MDSKYPNTSNMPSNANALDDKYRRKLEPVDRGDRTWLLSDTDLVDQQGVALLFAPLVPGEIWRIAVHPRHGLIAS